MQTIRRLSELKRREDEVVKTTNPASSPSSSLSQQRPDAINITTGYIHGGGGISPSAAAGGGGNTFSNAFGSPKSTRGGVKERSAHYFPNFEEEEDHGGDIDSNHSSSRRGSISSTTSLGGTGGKKRGSFSGSSGGPSGALIRKPIPKTESLPMVMQCLDGRKMLAATDFINRLNSPIPLEQNRDGKYVPKRSKGKTPGGAGTNGNNVGVLGQPLVLMSGDNQEHQMSLSGTNNFSSVDFGETQRSMFGSVDLGSGVGLVGDSSTSPPSFGGDPLVPLALRRSPQPQSGGNGGIQRTISQAMGKRPIPSSGGNGGHSSGGDGSAESKTSIAMALAARHRPGANETHGKFVSRDIISREGTKRKVEAERVFSLLSKHQRTRMTDAVIENNEAKAKLHAKKADQCVEAVFYPTCRLLESLWNHFRVGKEERRMVTERLFREPTQKNYLGVSSEVMKYTNKVVASHDILQLVNLRETLINTLFVRARSENLLESVKQAVQENVVVEIFNTILLLRHTTVKIVDAVYASRLKAADRENNEDESGDSNNKSNTGGGNNNTTSAHGSSGSAAAHQPLLWEGQNYLIKMQGDLSPLADTYLTMLIPNVRCAGNPMLLPPNYFVQTHLAQQQEGDTSLPSAESDGEGEGGRKQDASGHKRKGSASGAQQQGRTGSSSNSSPSPAWARGIPGFKSPTSSPIGRRKTSATPKGGGGGGLGPTTRRPTSVMSSMSNSASPSSASLLARKVSSGSNGSRAQTPAGLGSAGQRPGSSFSTTAPLTPPQRHGGGGVTNDTIVNGGSLLDDTLSSHGRGDSYTGGGGGTDPSQQQYEMSQFPLGGGKKKNIVKVREGEVVPVVKTTSIRQEYFKKREKQEYISSRKVEMDRSNVYQYPEHIYLPPKQPIWQITGGRLNRSMDPATVSKPYNDTVDYSRMQFGRLSEPPLYTSEVMNNNKKKSEGGESSDGTMDSTKKAEGSASDAGFPSVLLDSDTKGYRPTAPVPHYSFEELHARELLIFGENATMKKAAVKGKLRRALFKFRIAQRGFFSLLKRHREAEGEKDPFGGSQSPDWMDGAGSPSASMVFGATATGNHHGSSGIVPLGRGAAMSGGGSTAYFGGSTTDPSGVFGRGGHHHHKNALTTMQQQNQRIEAGNRFLEWVKKFSPEWIEEIGPQLNPEAFPSSSPSKNNRNNSLKKKGKRSTSPSGGGEERGGEDGGSSSTMEESTLPESVLNNPVLAATIAAALNQDTSDEDSEEEDVIDEDDDGGAHQLTGLGGAGATLASRGSKAKKTGVADDTWIL